MAFPALAADTGNSADRPWVRNWRFGVCPRQGLHDGRTRRAALTPLDGTGSLKVAITNYGDGAWWTKNLAVTGVSYTVSAHVRVDAASTSSFQVCPFVYYADGTSAESCATSSPGMGDKGVLSATLPLSAKAVSRAAIRLKQLGSQAISATVDDVTAVVTTNLVSTGPESDSNPDGDLDRESSRADPGFRVRALRILYRRIEPDARA